MRRVLIEPWETQATQAEAVPLVSAIHEVLDRAGVSAPRLQHSDGKLTWILLEDAVRRNLDTRIGLEDTLYLPDGSRASGNAALVQAARDLGAGICLISGDSGLENTTPRPGGPCGQPMVLAPSKDSRMMSA